MGVAKPSFLQTQLQRMGDTPQPQNYDDIKWAAAGMFGSTVTTYYVVLRPRDLDPLKLRRRYGVP